MLRANSKEDLLSSKRNGSRSRPLLPSSCPPGPTNHFSLFPAPLLSRKTSHLLIYRFLKGNRTFYPCSSCFQPPCHILSLLIFQADDKSLKCVCVCPIKGWRNLSGGGLWTLSYQTLSLRWHYCPAQGIKSVLLSLPKLDWFFFFWVAGDNYCFTRYGDGLRARGLLYNAQAKAGCCWNSTRVLFSYRIQPEPCRSPAF